MAHCSPATYRTLRALVDAPAPRCTRCPRENPSRSAPSSSSAGHPKVSRAETDSNGNVAQTFEVEITAVADSAGGGAEGPR